MSIQTYTKSLLDPFDKGMSQPKLLDGKVSRSSGIRLRATGEITCNSAGSTYLALIPGHSNVLCWRVTDDPNVPEVTPAPFAGHLDTEADRANVKAVRNVGTALRLSLVNSADQIVLISWVLARIFLGVVISLGGRHVDEPEGLPDVGELDGNEFVTGDEEWGWTETEERLDPDEVVFVNGDEEICSELDDDETFCDMEVPVDNAEEVREDDGASDRAVKRLRVLSSPSRHMEASQVDHSNLVTLRQNRA